MKYWLHRISHQAEVAYPLLDKGYLSIGFSDFSTKEFIENTEDKDNGWSFFEDYIQKTWKFLPRSRYSLWRFINGMKKGDIVIIPSWGTFSIYEILDNSSIPIGEINFSNLKTWNKEKIIKENNFLFKEENNTLIDLGFLRKVKLIERNISRYEYANSALTKRMKIRQTNSDISDLEKDINISLENYKNKRPINLYSQILEKTKKDVLRTIRIELNPDKFERLIKAYFEKIGATDVYIPAKNEREKKGDADIVATFESLKTIYYVQAKFHDNETSEWASTQIHEYKENKDKMDDGYSRIPWVISTADSFSQNCVDSAKENSVRLFNGIDFSILILEAGIGELKDL